MPKFAPGLIAEAQVSSVSAHFDTNHLRRQRLIKLRLFPTRYLSTDGYFVRVFEKLWIGRLYYRNAQIGRDVAASWNLADQAKNK